MSLSDLSHQRGKRMNVTIGRVDNVMTICYIVKLQHQRERYVLQQRERERLYNRERYYNRDREKEEKRERLQQINKKIYMQLSDIVEKVMS